MRGWLVVIAVLIALVSFPLYAVGSLWYSESKGPFKNWTQVVDLDIFTGRNERDYRVWVNCGAGVFSAGLQ